MKNTKEVYFNEYCHKCKNKSKRESEDPCFECLAIPCNEDSHRPVRFEEK